MSGAACGERAWGPQVHGNGHLTAQMVASQWAGGGHASSFEATGVSVAGIPGMADLWN